MITHRPALLLAVAASLSLAAPACSSDPTAPSATGADPTGAGSGTTASGGAGGAGTGGTGAGTGAGTGTGTGTGGFEPGGELTTHQAVMGPITVESGYESTQCVTINLKNPEPVLVRRFRAMLTEGSHHMIVYRSNETTEKPNPVKCGGFSGVFAGDHPIFIAQQADAELVFPTEDGVPVGLELEANQMLRVEMHFINTTGKPLEVKGTSLVDTIPLSADVIRSDIAFWGTTSIHIPPNSSFDTGVKFQSALSDTKTFALTTHQHQLGTRMRVWYAKDASDVDGEPVADSTNWSDPPLETYDPPLVFPQGSGDVSSMGLAYRCEWTNPTSKTVTFGESFNSEMCFLWQYYYPSQGFRLCMNGSCK